MGDWDARRGWRARDRRRRRRRRSGKRGGYRIGGTACDSPRDAQGKEGESSMLYVAVIFYGLSHIILERASLHCRLVQGVPELFDVPSRCEIFLRRVKRTLYMRLFETSGRIIEGNILKSQYIY